MTVRSITATTVETLADVVDASMRRPVLAVFWVSTSGRFRYRLYPNVSEACASQRRYQARPQDVAAVADGPGSCGWDPEAIERLGIMQFNNSAYVGGIAVRSLLGEQPEARFSSPVW
jgi:hypothetical protein